MTYNVFGGTLSLTQSINQVFPTVGWMGISRVTGHKQKVSITNGECILSLACGAKKDILSSDSMLIE